MHYKKALLFLGLSASFAFVHYVAVQSSLYWVFKWFDIVMHFWGGGLIALGVHTLCSFSRINCRANLTNVLITLLAVTTTWEIFEWFVGLYDPATYFVDTAKDVMVGFAGGLLTHSLLQRYTIS
tara:strand:- start:7255 stop:7626 length:372 start_codon:yes stop_codon:yes gene_type:complete